MGIRIRSKVLFSLMSMLPSTGGMLRPLARASAMVRDCTLKDTGWAMRVSDFRTIALIISMSSLLAYSFKLNLMTTAKKQINKQLLYLPIGRD